MKCKNCNESLKETYEFCYVCGGQVITNRITVKSLITEFAERYFSFDNKFFTTFKALFTKPEDVILGYINGVRGKYVNPFTYLVIALTISGFQLFLMKKGWLGADFNEMIAQTDNKKSPFDMKAYMDGVMDYQNIIIVLSIPFLAFISKLTFWKNKTFNYAEHIVFLSYSYSHYTIFAGILILISIIHNGLFLPLTMITSLLMFVYMIYAVYRVYFLSPIQLIKKVILYFVFLFLLFVLITIIAVLVGFAYAKLIN